MAHGAGRQAQLYWGDDSPSELVAGLTNLSLTVNGEGITTTDFDDSGWQTMLDSEAVKSVEITAEGVTDNDTLRSDKINGSIQQAATFVFYDGSTLTGTFNLQNYQETGEVEGATTFSVTLASSGQPTYTSNV